MVITSVTEIPPIKLHVPHLETWLIINFQFITIRYFQTKHAFLRFIFVFIKQRNLNIVELHCIYNNLRYKQKVRMIYLTGK